MVLVSTEQPLHAHIATPAFDAWLVPAAARHDGDRTVISLYGEHDLFNRDAMADLVDRAISFDESDVEIDLSGVQFMCSATVHDIVDARERLRLRSRSLTLTSPSRIACLLLDLCGVPMRTD